MCDTLSIQKLLAFRRKKMEQKLIQRQSLEAARSASPNASTTDPGVVCEILDGGRKKFHR